MWLKQADSFLEPWLAFSGGDAEWYTDLKIYVGCVLYLAFWVMTYFNHKNLYLARWIEIVALDLLMLHLLQSSVTELNKMVALTLIGMHFGGMCIVDHFKNTKTFKHFTAHNIYQDLNCGWDKTVTVFLGQVFLVYLYTHCILQDEIDWDKVSYTYWLGSIMAIQMASMFGRGGDSQLGFAYHVRLWSFIVTKVTRITQNIDDEVVELSISKAELRARALMAFFVNQVMRCLVGASMPLILMQSEKPMDFLQNSLAVAFIFQLDDTSMGGTYTLTAESAADVEAAQRENLIAK